MLKSEVNLLKNLSEEVVIKFSLRIPNIDELQTYLNEIKILIGEMERDSELSSDLVTEYKKFQTQAR